MTKLLQDVGIGTNLKRLRTARRLTQENLCAKMTLRGRPMSQSAYSQIESGARNIFISDLIVLKEIYNVPYDEFFRDIRPVNKYEQWSGSGGKPEGAE